MVRIVAIKIYKRSTCRLTASNAFPQSHHKLLSMLQVMVPEAMSSLSLNEIVAVEASAIPRISCLNNNLIKSLLGSKSSKLSRLRQNSSLAVVLIVNQALMETNNTNSLRVSSSNKIFKTRLRVLFTLNQLLTQAITTMKLTL